MGYTGMCRSTGCGFCLSESGTGSTNQSVSVWNRVYFNFGIPTLEHGLGYCFAARIAMQMNLVAVPARILLHVYSTMPFPIHRSTTSHIFQSRTGYLFSQFCLEQGSEIVSL